MSLPEGSISAGIRETQFQAALAAVHANKSFQVLGARGSGRTRFLDRLAARLADDGWTVHRVMGVAALRQHPLGALQVAGLMRNPAQRNAHVSLAAATDELEELFVRRSVVLVDEWDDLDEATWGVLSSSRVRFCVPLVIARLSCRAGQTSAAGLMPSLSIELRPIGYEEVRLLVEEALGGPVAPELVGEVFVQSGGHVGMISSLVDAAVREQRVERVDGVWNQVRGLYSPSLRWWFEALLAELSDDARHALEVVALSKRVTFAAFRGLIPWDAVEELERRELIQLVGASDQIVVVHPPALVEFFSDSVTDAARVVLREKLAGLAGVELDASGILRRPAHIDQGPVLAGVITARLQSDRVDAHARWRADPSAATATTYLRTLMRDRASTAEFEDVVQNTPATTGAAQLAYLFAQADWHAYREGNLQAATAVLEDVAAEDSATGLFARAKVVQLSVMLGVVPDDFEYRLAIDDEYPDDVKAAAEATLAAACLAHGKVRQAEQHFARLRGTKTTTLGLDVDVLGCLITLHAGRFKEAARSAAEAYHAAAERFDTEALRAFSWLHTRTLLYLRDFDAMERVLTLLAGVPETPTRGIYHLGLLINAVLVALHRDQPDLARKYISEMERIPVPDGPFPGQQRDLARARLAMYEGDVEQGARMLRELGERLWARGLRIAAVQAFLFSHEVILQPEYLEDDLAKCAHVDGRLTGLHVDYSRAMFADDVGGLSEAAYEMVENGLHVWALGSLHRAHELVTLKDEGSRSEQIHARITKLKAQLPPGTGVATRSRMVRIRLTAREMEFAEQVATGASNKEIAARMMVSKRTVESAVARISRKLNARGRSGITAWVQQQRAPVRSA